MQVVSTYLCLSIYLSVCLSVCLSVSIYLTIYLPTSYINIYIYIILTQKLFDKQETLRTRYRKNLPEQNRRAISSFKTRHHPGRKTVWEKLCSMALLNFIFKTSLEKCIHSKARFSPHMQLPETYMGSFFHLSPLQRSLQYVFSGPR